MRKAHHIILPQGPVSGLNKESWKQIMESLKHHPGSCTSCSDTGPHHPRGPQWSGTWKSQRGPNMIISFNPVGCSKKRTEWQLLIIAVKGPVHDTFHPCPLGIISFFLVLGFLRGSTLCGPLGHPFLHDDGPLSHSQAAKCGYGY